MKTQYLKYGSFNAEAVGAAGFVMDQVLGNIDALIDVQGAADAAGGQSVREARAWCEAGVVYPMQHRADPRVADEGPGRVPLPAEAAEPTSARDRHQNGGLTLKRVAFLAVPRKLTRKNTKRKGP